MYTILQQHRNLTFLRYKIGYLRTKRTFIKTKNMEDLDQQLTGLVLEKFDIQNDEAESKIEALLLVGIRLERARVAFLALNPDADFIDVASGLISLADLFDDANLSADNRPKLESAVAKILKVTDPAKVAAATEVFLSVLDAGLTARDTGDFVNGLITPPDPV